MVWTNGSELHLVADFLWRTYDCIGALRNYRRLALRAVVYRSRLATRPYFSAALCAVSRVAFACDSFERGNCCIELTKKAASLPPFRLDPNQWLHEPHKPALKF